MGLRPKLSITYKSLHIYSYHIATVWNEYITRLNMCVLKKSNFLIVCGNELK